MKRTRWWVWLAAAFVALFALAALFLVRHGFSAREEPTAVEALLARRMRGWATPSVARSLSNPVPAGSATLAAARAHFADHCATCHGNDGRGKTTIGQNLYPKTPDMTLAATQDLSDGEIFYIIKNGVRLTGMPAWGEDTPVGDRETWQLVHFIRHLPDLAPGELEEMEGLNPRTPMELRQAEEEQRFLQGDATNDVAPGHAH